MKRSVSDVLRRGFENVVANWPLLAILIAESIVVIVIVVAAVFAALVPLFVSIGLGAKDLPQLDPQNLAGDILSILMGHLLVLLWIFVVVSVLLLLIVMVHSFVMAGCARVYADAERQVKTLPAPSRLNMRTFTADRWMRGGKEGWWAVFWIYNVTWSIALLIIMIPFVVLAAVVILMRDSAPAMAITGCLGILAAVLFMAPVLIATAIWTQKAIVNAVVRALGVRDALETAWSEFKSDLGRHVGITAVMIVVSIAASLAFSSMSMFSSLGHQQPSLNIMLMPLQFAGSILNSVFSAAVGAWFLACFASLAVERT